MARPPYFGLVKRAMNRPPGPSDSWYKQHQETCGGDYVKIAGPPEKAKLGQEPVQKNKIIGWLKGSTACKGDDKGTPAEGSHRDQGQQESPVAVGPQTQGRKRRRDTADEGRAFGNGWGNSQDPIQIDDADDDDIMVVGENRQNMVVCPVCFDKIWETLINRHLDNEHGL